MKRFGYQLLLLVMSEFMILGCSEKPESLIGPIQDVSGIEGYLFPEKGEPGGIPFRGGVSEAQSIGRLLSQGSSGEDGKWPFRAYFNLLCKDGHKVDVQVMKPVNTVLVKGKAFNVDAPSLMTMLEALATQKH
jgi:hypothetical protein